MTKWPNDQMTKWPNDQISISITVQISFELDSKDFHSCWLLDCVNFYLTVDLKISDDRWHMSHNKTTSKTYIHDAITYKDKLENAMPLTNMNPSSPLAMSRIKSRSRLGLAINDVKDSPNFAIQSPILSWGIST